MSQKAVLDERLALCRAFVQEVLDDGQEFFMVLEDDGAATIIIERWSEARCAARPPGKGRKRFDDQLYNFSREEFFDTLRPLGRIGRVQQIRPG